MMHPKEKHDICFARLPTPTANVGLLCGSTELYAY